jgi:YidC/Oxa1 family membrane protein insertase
MDRSSLIRTLLIIGASILFFKFALPKITGKSDVPQAIPSEHYVNAPGFEPDVVDGAPGGPATPPEGEQCTIKGNRFDAQLNSRGAGLEHLWIRDPQYAAGSTGLDISTTPDHERWRNLRTLFRELPVSGDVAPAPDDQVKFDRFNWKVESLGGTGCKFTYADDGVSIEKTITATGHPFELAVSTTIKNLATSAKKHRFSIQEFAYRSNHEVKGHLGRVSPFQTDLQCARTGDVVRKNKDDFKTGWYTQPLSNRYTAIANTFFAQALMPVPAKDEVAPECEILAEQWFAPGQDKDDDNAGAIYHSTLEYPSRELQPNESATYQDVAFFGPKEREILSKVDGGAPHLNDLINLGFFSPVARVLVGILAFFHDHITFGNWGLAIVAMTICLKLVLFPLSIPQIRTMIAMRRLKPEIDAVNKKFAHDAQAKQMATMEVYRKNKVNPLGGCLPQLVQMPVWFAMYTTLQTAVEMYHVKFLWFADLSAPDQFYILPILLVGTQILNQRIVPQQGMDPVQQKMMMFLMPAVFGVMMIFLPAALGVYMLTNQALGIVQQLAVQKVAPAAAINGGSSSTGSDIVVKPVTDKSEKARV